ncbi:hypothetical protein BSKO_12421 [Bryopsis sp. KO-2023]|nr:hypothetical protein BSKO_12421 [Bryopsis sp. KO-2023]
MRCPFASSVDTGGSLGLTSNICRRASLSLPKSTVGAAIRPCSFRRGGSLDLRRLEGGRPSTRQCAQHRRSFDVVAELKGKGKRYLARDITVKKIMGQGSYGQVFEGELSKPNGDTERVVLKRVRSSVEGAKEMVEMEHLMNVHACKAAKGCVADFIGYCGVSKKEANSMVTEGLWLLWKYEGCNTLQFYLRRRDCIPALAMDMGVSERAVVPTVIKQVMENLKGMHSAGLVHRDVKPSNLVLVEETRRFKFIDLGACVDLRSGTNYVPGESILDPLYCPPEQHILPTDCPELSSNILSRAISPMLWVKHMPDRFDMYSTGLIFLQLAIPSLHKDSGMRKFRNDHKAYDFDLDRWRRGAVNLKPRHTQVLDANDEAGWKLLEGLLRPRLIERVEGGGVKFIQNGLAPRLSAEEALKFTFLKQSERPSKRPSRPSVSIWKSVTRQLFNLENAILDQAAETDRQTTTVKKVRKDFAKGKASKEALEKEEKSLVEMEEELDSLAEKFEDKTREAFNIFGVVKSVGSLFSFSSQTTSVTENKPKKAEQKTVEEPAPQKPVEVEPVATKPAEEEPAEVARPFDVIPSNAKPAAAEPATEKPTVAKAADAKPVEKKGGLFGWWGRKKSAEKQEVEAPPKKQVPVEAKVVVEEAPKAAPPKIAPEAAPKRVVPKKSARSTANKVVQIGMRFTGVAARIAGDLAGVIKEDVEHIFSDMEERAASKREELRRDEDFVQMLKSMEPGLSSKCRYSTVKALCGSDPRFVALTSEPHKIKLFENYRKTLQRSEDEKRIVAENDLRAMYEEMNVGIGSDWKDVHGQLRGTTVFESVKDQATRRQIYDSVVAENKLKYAQEKMKAEAEADFHTLLRDLNVSVSSTWSKVKREVYTDPRSQPLPEARKKALFEEYQVMAKQNEKALVDQATGLKEQILSMEEVSSADEEIDQDMEVEELSAAKLQQLKEEQAKLRDEYAKMEARLKEMEARMEATLRGSAFTPPDGTDLEISSSSVSSISSRNGTKQ